jgi:Zn-dependent M28 family amino/carboxypeptidase
MVMTMTMTMRHLLLFWLLPCACVTVEPKVVVAPEVGHSPEIDAKEIEAHIRFLADDTLEGRAIGSRGLAVAASYHESVFRSLGLEPIFDNGTRYRQPFSLVGSRPDEAATLDVEGAELKLERGDDFVVISQRRDAPKEVTGELVYGGYLIQAPGRGWDDIKGTDLRGKVLLVEVNEPGNRPGGIFDGRAMTYYGRWTYKFEAAARLGAAGVLIVHNTKRAAYGWDVVRNSWSGEGFFIDDGRAQSSFQGWVQEGVARRLLALAKKDHADLLARAERPDFKPVPTGVQIRVQQRPTFRSVTVENVAALLRAKHPDRRERYVVLSAHFDHLGSSPDGALSDRIYNGAVDNSSASAVLLTLARHFARQPERLKTHLIFLAATAEEEGLWGSDYFARRLPVDRNKVLANINFELTNIWGETRDLYAIGSRQSTLDSTCREAAKDLGYAYTAEKGAEHGFFFRSDQLSFARAGIPAVWLHEGEVSKGGDPGHIVAMRKQYRERHYHKPSDDVRTLQGQWDLRGTAQIARWAARIVERLGELEKAPRFNKTSAFSGRER